jgi:hypothetical protein
VFVYFCVQIIHICVIFFCIFVFISRYFVFNLLNTNPVSNWIRLDFRWVGFHKKTLARAPTGGPNVLLCIVGINFEIPLSLTEYQIYRFLLQIAKCLRQMVSCSLPDLILVCRIFVPSE